MYIFLKLLVNKKRFTCLEVDFFAYLKVMWNLFAESYGDKYFNNDTY